MNASHSLIKVQPQSLSSMVLWMYLRLVDLFDNVVGALFIPSLCNVPASFNGG